MKKIALHTQIIIGLILGLGVGLLFVQLGLPAEFVLDYINKIKNYDWVDFEWYCLPYGTEVWVLGRRQSIMIWGEKRIKEGRTCRPLPDDVITGYHFGLDHSTPMTNHIDYYTMQGKKGNVAFLTGVRASNSIGYLSPSMGGVKLWAQTYMGENASTAAKVGNGNSYRITFDQGALSLAYAGSKTTTAAGVSNDTSNMAGSYDLGVAKLMAQSNSTKITGLADLKGSLIGALVPMAGGTFRISSAQSERAGNKQKQTSVGFVNPMSKRTDLYATYARLANSGGSAVGLNGSATAANQSSTGYEFGIKHAF
mgnify:CR=1 FL=1